MLVPNPADKVEQWPLERLKPYERNARTHSEAQIGQLAASIREWGFTVPVLATKAGQIVAGHGRVEAARRVGLVQVPVVIADGWTDAQVRAYTLADNRLALNAGWDAELLAVELDDLRELGVDLHMLGFERAELNELVGTPNSGRDPEQTPPAPAVPVSRLGDVWLCGKHRILCGDATSATDVERLLGDVKPLLMVTDPPYGVDYDPNWRNEAKRAGAIDRVIGATAIGKVLNDSQADWREAWKLFHGDVAYVWHAGNKAHVVADSLLASGFEIRAQVIWAKHRMVISRGHYHPHHEPLWYAVRKGATGHWSGDRTQTTLWTIEHMKSETGHGTQKPVECMRRPIENNSVPGEAVYDPFLGSGTTLIAAEQTKRVCYGLELSPAYVDVIVQRWQAFTGGRDAILEGADLTFAQVTHARKEAEANSSQAA